MGQGKIPNPIAVAKRPPVKSPFGVALRGMATMSPKGCTVEIYEESIADMARWCGMDQDLAERIHLAHEFFHFLEYQRRPFFLEKLEPVVTARLLGYARKAAINRCSEAAAHAFAKTLLGLERLPNYYDYVYLIAIGKMTQEAFEEKLGLYADMLGGAAGPPSG